MKTLIILLALLILAGCQTPINGPEKAKYAPVESVHQNAYYSLPTPPSGFTVAVGWMQAIDIDGEGTPSKVEVDWMKLHATVNSKDTVLYEDNFDLQTEAMSWYGLYSRNPWFAGDRIAPMSFNVENGVLIMEPHFNSNRVYHWWNTNRALVPAGATRIWFESSVRITGAAGVQAGIDYWRDSVAQPAGLNVNNTEAGASEWIGNSTANWQILTVGKP